MFWGRLFGSPRRAAVTLAVFALAVRLTAVLTVLSNRSFFLDEQNYFNEAGRMAAGEWLGSSTLLPPGETYFIASGLGLGLGVTGLRIVQALLGALAVALTVRLSSRLFGLRIGILAGALMSVHPYLVYLSAVFHTQNQVIPLLLLLVFALYRRQERGGRRWLFAAGISLGVAGCFMVPVFLTAPFLGVWHALRLPRLRRGVLDVALLAVVAALTLIPVTYRNYRLTDRLIFVADLPAKAHLPAAAADGGAPLETGGERVGRARMMWLLPSPYLNGASTKRFALVLAGFTSATVLLAALAGAALFVRRMGLLFPFYALPVVLTATFAFLHATVRNRLTVEPFLLILASAAVVRLFWPWRLGGRIGSRLAASSSDPSLTQGVAS